jgi:hypothetical protein
MAKKTVAKKKKNVVSKFFINIAMLIVSLLKIIPNLFLLIELEAADAGKSIISLIVLYVIAVVLLTTLWLCSIGIGFVFLTSLHLSVIASLCIIGVFNFLLLIITYLFILRTRYNFTFAKTRRYLRDKMNRIS